MSNIFIHPEYKKRLSEIIQTYFLNNLRNQSIPYMKYDSDEYTDYFPIYLAIIEGELLDESEYYLYYYVNVNMNSPNFNKLYEITKPVISGDINFMVTDLNLMNNCEDEIVLIYHKEVRNKSTIKTHIIDIGG
jgi:hypothetical protein